jgi:hypothetical protein
LTAPHLRSAGGRRTPSRSGTELASDSPAAFPEQAMQRSSLRIAAAIAALGAAPPAVFAQSLVDDPQSARRDRWVLAAERALWEGEQALRSIPPAGLDAGWLRSTDFRPSVQVGLAQGWALCADWDRYRPKVVHARESIDTFLLGLQYKFP